MAVDRLLQRGDTLRFLAGRDHFQKFQNHSDVTAAMSAEIRRKLRHINHLSRLSKQSDFDNIFCHIRCDIAFCSHDLTVTGSAVTRKSAHGKADVAAVGVFNIRDLMIYNVVVAMEYTASVRSCLDRFIDAFLCRMNCQNVNRPFGVALCDAGTLVGDINFFRIKRTVSFCLTAVHAAKRSTLRCTSFLEEISISHRGHALWRLVRQPQIQVEIVTGLLQTHGAGRIAVSPVAAHEAVGLMPVADVLDGLNRYDVADGSLRNDLFDLREKGRIAQHMTDYDFSVVLAGRFQQLITVLCTGGNRLLHQDMVAFFQRHQRFPDMILILCADKNRICQLRLRQKLFRARKTALFRYVVLFCSFLYTGRIDICQRCNLH